MEEFSRNVDSIVKGISPWRGQITKHAVKCGEK
jgi:hypothetical protein